MSPLESKNKVPISELLKDPCYLLIIFSSLNKRKSGGVDDVPITNVTLASILQLSIQLDNHSYKPMPVRRVYIPKANGNRRPLGIASSRDKIVQQAIRVPLEAIFEKYFSENSHGFRPKRSCHSALKQIFL